MLRARCLEPESALGSISLFLSPAHDEDGAQGCHLPFPDAGHPTCPFQPSALPRLIWCQGTHRCQMASSVYYNHYSFIEGCPHRSECSFPPSPLRFVSVGFSLTLLRVLPFPIPFSPYFLLNQKLSFSLRLIGLSRRKSEIFFLVQKIPNILK